MKLVELESVPHLYLDMDGVQADFFTAWASLHGVEKYKEIGSKEERERSIKDLTARGANFVENFFANLEPLPGGMKLVAWLKENQIPFTVLSAPLRNPEGTPAKINKKIITPKMASIKGKKTWLDKHNPGSSASAKFNGMKEVYAVTTQPNILIDDYKNYIQRWNEKGGIGILYREEKLDSVLEQLAKIYGINSQKDQQ